jgi:type II secretory pathway pseudopilin PulG
MRTNKGFSMIELIILLSLLNILATIAVTSYADYTKKARIAEAPLMLKALVLRIDEYMKDAPPKSNGKCELVGSNGRCQDNFPKNADDIGFRTNRGSVFGSFFEFKVKSPIPTGCDQNNLDRFAYAVPIIKTSVPDDYQFMCMNERFDLFHGSKSSDNGGGGMPVVTVAATIMETMPVVTVAVMVVVTIMETMPVATVVETVAVKTTETMPVVKTMETMPVVTVAERKISCCIYKYLCTDNSILTN